MWTLSFAFLCLRLSSRLSKCPSLPFLFVLFSVRLCLSRSWWNNWFEVPTVLSYSLLQQQTAEQIPGGEGARGSLQGLPQGHGSTASAGEQTIVPSRGGLQGLPQGQGSTASAGEQTIVPVRGGLKGFPKDRVPQRLPVSRPSLLIVEVFKVFPEDSVPQRLPLSRTSLLIVFKVFPRGQSSAASSGEQTIVPSRGDEVTLLFRKTTEWRPQLRVPCSQDSATALRLQGILQALRSSGVTGPLLL